MKISIHSSDIADTISNFGQGSISSFGLQEFKDVERWSGALDGCLLARSLSSIIDCDSSSDLVEACAGSIAALDCWRTLVDELLLGGEVSTAAIDVVRQVYRRHVPTHLLANFPHPPKDALLVCDAINDGEVVQFGTSKVISTSYEWLVMDLERPTDCAALVKVKQVGNRIRLPLGQLFWLKPDRLACSAFIAVI